MTRFLTACLFILLSLTASFAQTRSPFPTNTRVIVVGDSRSENGKQIDASNVSAVARGILPWAKYRTYQRFDHDIGDIYATTGFTTQQIINTWLTPAVASPAGLAVVLASTNDRTALLPAETSIANLTTIRDALLASGKIVVFICETPRGGAFVLASPQIQYMQRVRQWCLQQTTTPRVYVVDPWPVLADPASATGANLSTYFADDLHPNQYGAYYGYTGLVTLFNYLYPPRNILPATNSDVYDATNNPGGVLSANPMTQGTGGTVTAPGAGTMTGTAANSHTATLTNGTGLTVTLDSVTTAGKTWQRIVVSGTPTSAGANVTFTLPSVAASNFTIGDTIDSFVEVEMDANQTGMNRYTMTISDNGAAGGAKSRRDLERVSTTDIMPTDALAGVMRGSAFAITGSGSVVPSVTFGFIQNVAVSATIRFRCLGIRKVISANDNWLTTMSNVA